MANLRQKFVFKRLYDFTPRQVVQIIRRSLFNNRGYFNLHDSPEPFVFVLSTGRTGTKTLAALLALAKNVFVYHEPRPLLYGLSKLSYEYSNDDVVSKVLREAFFTVRKQMFDYSLDCNRGYIETSPQVTFMAPIILALIPNVRFIHLIRDPRMVVRSGMRRGWYSGHPADRTRIVPRSGSAADRIWAKWTPFQKNLWLWEETNCWINEFIEDLSSDQYMSIYSEDLFDGRKDIIEELYHFIQSPVPTENKINRVLSEKLNAQSIGTFPESSEWTNEMNNDLLEIAGSIVKNTRYSLK